MKHISLLLSAALLFSVGACRSHPETDPHPIEEAAPAASYTFNRTFYYPVSSVGSGVSYAPSRIAALVSWTSGHGSFFLSFADDDDLDGLRLTLLPARVKPGIVGTYTLQSTTAPGNDAEVSYYHNQHTGTTRWGNTYTSANTDFQGQLVITAYDARRHLLSGRYEVRLPDVADPDNPALTDAGKARCRVTVSGSFENMRVGQDD
ncbi:hypothetical protein LJ737_22100 [Hymenobacter sp. 15J16-1T3B]|uniref:hypothetical protein n=1 Tax=Hymenobacter sp. 15J16-1T3B TaxID=2886941 RepID=UPI001D0FE1B3|nr:hypothetical protein [Hymenobacter sp. 15J16-1T3B]MCC3159948.1 hypothetical protein [Hymenobacter sp. 15J16-1T3B]